MGFASRQRVVGVFSRVGSIPARARGLSGPDWWERRYWVAAAMVLALAVFNLTFRIGQEAVTEWDESLYATSAYEMVTSGDWLVTTFHGQVDYYNTKPPLNIWMIAASFKALGPTLVALRLPSILCALITVAVLLVWTKRVFGALVSLAATTVLATTFGFLYVHSGRTANTDAAFTLLMLLTAVTAWATRRRPWALAAAGPVLAATFLLRGTAALLPLSLLGMAWLMDRSRRRWRIGPALVAALLFAAPVAVWVWMRWQFDGWEFLGRMVRYDLVARATRVIEEHPGPPWYYLGILVKHQYDWLLAGLVAWLLCPATWRPIRTTAVGWLRQNDAGLSLFALGTATLLVPSLMQTKVPWYLNSFYPLFAIGVGALIVRAMRGLATAGRARRLALVATVLVVAVAAETKLIAYSFQYRDLGTAPHGLLLSQRKHVMGRTVYRDRWTRAGVFVTVGILGGRARVSTDAGHFVRESRPGDFLLTSKPQRHPGIHFVSRNRSGWLYRRPLRAIDPARPVREGGSPYPPGLMSPAVGSQ